MMYLSGKKHWTCYNYRWIYV